MLIYRWQNYHPRYRLRSCKLTALLTTAWICIRGVRAGWVIIPGAVNLGMFVVAKTIRQALISWPAAGNVRMCSAVQTTRNMSALWVDAGSGLDITGRYVGMKCHGTSRKQAASDVLRLVVAAEEWKVHY